jgi:predicted nucleic acid-binding protein
MDKVVLDTDILSEIIKRKDRLVIDRAAAYVAAQGKLTLTAISVMEIVYGLRRRGREDRVVQFEASLQAAEVLSFDESAGRLAGRINADLETRGRRIGMPDVMIAAIAINQKLPVVTGNVAYEAIHDVGYALRLENWRSP